MIEITPTNFDKYRVKILVSPQYLDLVSQFKWAVAKFGNSNTLYARSSPKYRKSFLMHRLIMGLVDLETFDNLDPKMFVDHLNHNGLDNRYENLRVVDHRTNMKNLQRVKTGASGFQGVHLDKRKTNKCWQARIRVDYKKIGLGYYTDASEAAKAYDRAAIKYFGETCVLNFPELREVYLSEVGVSQ